MVLCLCYRSSRADQTAEPFLKDSYLTLWIRLPNREPQDKIRCLFSYLNLSKFFFQKKPILKNESTFLCIYLMIFSCRVTVENCHSMGFGGFLVDDASVVPILPLI